MEIRLLYGTELQWAVNTANEVFECCVRNELGTQQETDWYYGYMRPEYLWQEMSAGRLILWGAFENGQMCAVSAMQNTGHITMLYVRTPFWHRGIGTRLLDEMCGYAVSVLGIERLTVRTAPGAAAFFYRRGFLYQPGAPDGSVFLECPLWGFTAAERPAVSYPVKKVKSGVVLGITAFVLILSILLIGGVTINHIAGQI